MSAKSKILAILVLSFFATAAGVYITHRQQSVQFTVNGQQQHLSAAVSAQELVANPERANYKTIPLDSIKSVLQGSDPAALALDAFDIVESERGTRKVEVSYPQPNQALVTITKTKEKRNPGNAVKYRVELTSFGRSLLASSPPLWQITWAGSQEKCFVNQGKQKLAMAACQ
ncbi:hypothetical protein QUB80_21075 [Chlorogloeopsis sp. ULAP01]|uniref:hypothetical protein n=1 Tax=Chlorogloeopsis sp. ULAP01 TaxID=3056483 RepID=UPI0025AA5DFD|nr:hypothetical protein [Chlorogloeopsis sp. ULAP01]MDM9383190.1 hypothetical protein [Chlorogloeopsis sp. ULAP01]